MFAEKTGKTFGYKKKVITKLLIPGEKGKMSDYKKNFEYIRKIFDYQKNSTFSPPKKNFQKCSVFFQFFSHLRMRKKFWKNFKLEKSHDLLKIKILGKCYAQKFLGRQT